MGRLAQKPVRRPGQSGSRQDFRPYLLQASQPPGEFRDWFRTACPGYCDFPSHDAASGRLKDVSNLIAGFDFIKELTELMHQSGIPAAHLQDKRWIV